MGKGSDDRSGQRVGLSIIWEIQLKELKIVTHVENAGSQKVALKAGFRLFRQFKGSDRYTRKMRDYYDFR